MGLDMYLSARKYVNKIDWEKMREVEDYSSATIPEYQEIINAAGLNEVANNDIYGASVSVNCAYWRKANQIHSWFVQNVQDGEDNCGEYYVSHEKLKELHDVCTRALTNKNPNLLPPQEGFFFGGTDIDEYYWLDIQNTIKQLIKIIKLPNFDELSFYYQSSW